MTATRPWERRRRHRPGLLLRLLAVLVLTLAAGVGLAGPAAAHNVLTGSDPADGATLQTAPATVSLTFDQPVQNFEPIVTVVGPDGGRYESGSPVVDSTEVTTDVGPLTVAGSYVIAYRIVSADGHPVQGEIRFELPASAVAPGGGNSAAATSAAATSAAESTADPVPSTSAVAAASTTGTSGLSGWMWVAIGLAALLVIAAVVVILRRPRPE